jgi:hypothetical protein
MERTRSSDVPTIVGAIVALIAAGAIIYGVVDAATQDETFDTNSPNGTTQGPPASFEER